MTYEDWLMGEAQQKVFEKFPQINFICSQCGACCRRAATIKDFPEETKEDGSCIHLEDNKCKIYDTRPDICRVEKQAKTSKLTQKKFYQLNNSLCNTMIIMDGLEDKYLTDIKEYGSENS